MLLLVHIGGDGGEEGRAEVPLPGVRQHGHQGRALSSGGGATAVGWGGGVLAAPRFLFCVLLFCLGVECGTYHFQVKNHLLTP